MIAKRQTKSRKRTKSYRPKQVRIPVMQDLHDSFSFCVHGALAALRLAPNEAAFNQLAQIFNVLAVSIKDIGLESAILDIAIQTMQQISDTLDKTGQVFIDQNALPSLEKATLECEKLLSKVDVMHLYAAGIKLNAIKLTETLELRK